MMIALKVMERVLGLLGIAALTSCSVIDEDLSDCDKQAKMDYELRLVTNMNTEMKTQLTTETDLKLEHALRQYLGGVFTDFAHDVDLSFYDTRDDSLRLQHDEHIMDANQASYTLNLPMRRYMHLATANILDNDLVTLEDDERCHRSRLQQVDRDTIASHSTGIFTARQPMEVLEGVDQNFDVHLYMANCAAMLVLDPRGYDTDGVQVYSTGFATGFNICDSSYVYPTKSPIVRTERIEAGDGSQESGDEVGFCSVTFPSRDEKGTRTVIETEEPFIAKESDESFWEFRVYVLQEDGSITETTLRIKKPLRAGQLMIIKGWLADRGIVMVEDQLVGVSVTLDWNKKSQGDVEL
jgi:hypothetical protein